MTLQDLLTKEYGIKTTVKINDKTSSVGTSLTRILDNNPNRVGWTIFNLGSNAVYLGFDRNVSASKGMRLAPSGGSINFMWDTEFDVVGYELFGKASTGTNNIYVIELITLP